jgi:hypothetical protein
MKFNEFKEKTENKTGCYIRYLCTDNGEEYTSKEFLEYLQKCWIRRQLTCPNTPKPTGVAEMKNQHLTETYRTMLHSKNVLPKFWTECIKETAYVINRLPQAWLDFILHYEKLRVIKPSMSYFWEFGCVCYEFIPSQQSSKFDKKAICCIFIGYDSWQKGWRCCDPLVSRNVVFDYASSLWSF